ncbi:MAG: diaminopimelate decarboxylase [Proteobacteria bacterium]|nr:diaminopimelate decarboxylase [Pseudomonadota bacterium]
MFKKLSQEFQTPFYCYDQAIIDNKINFLNNLELNFNYNFSFAIKANPNLAIINLFKQKDIGAVVVSSGELYKALRVGFKPSQIIFNGSSKNDFDLKYAVTQKICSINIENIEELKTINDYSREKGLISDIGIRINPGVNAETLSKISTGKSGDKFGIEIDQIDFDMIKNFNHINLKTLSVHIGSQITDHKKLIESYQLIINLADKLNKKGFEIQYLDFGGGFAVIDNGNQGLDFNLWSSELNSIMNHKNYKVIFEPGRFLIADSGYLVSKVDFLKKSGNKNIALLDSSMSEYVRCALYGIDPIIELIDTDQKSEKIKYDIGGGVCESSDFFIRDALLPPLKVGDIIIFKNVGAYGSSMSSNYNSRPRPLEVLFSKDEHRVIRSRDTLEDLCKNEIM